jgi:endonuclease III
MNKQKINKIFAALQENNPTPETELNYSNNFELVIAVALSAQATDISVNKATKELFKVANNAKDMYALGVDGLKQYIKSIGLFNSKAKNVIAACKILIDKHNGIVPNTRAQLEELPGVGRKTANVVLNTAFGQNTIAVDTHLFRLGNRTRIAPGKTPVEVEKKLLKNIPKKYHQNAHHWLILHGRYICVARKPKCDACIIESWCEFKDKQ